MDARRLFGTSEPVRGKAARELRVAKTFSPGHDGTRRLARAFGERLVCTRHRYDDANGRRITTVELVVQVDPLRGRAPPPRNAVAAWEAVWIRLAPDERTLRRQAIDSGGRWHPGVKLWEVPRWLVARLGLRDRVARSSAGSIG
jgi:hypothetical protein